MRRRLTLATIVLLAVVTQLAVVSRLRVVGVAPDLVVLVVAAVASAGGSEVGALAGFAAGLLVDLFLPTAAGLTALAYTVVGYTVGRLTAGVLESTWWTGPVVAAAAAAVSTGLYVIVGGLVGESQLLRTHTLIVLPVTTVLTGLLAVVGFPIVTRLVPPRRPTRAEPLPTRVGAW